MHLQEILSCKNEQTAYIKYKKIYPKYHIYYNKLGKFLLKFYLFNLYKKYQICHKHSKFRIERFKFLSAVIPNSCKFLTLIIIFLTNNN